MTDKYKYPVENHPVDHMKYMLLLNYLENLGDDAESNRTRDQLLDKIDFNNISLAGKDGIDKSKFMVEISKAYDGFIGNNDNIKSLVDSRLDRNNPKLFITASGLDVNMVSPEFIKDLEVIYEYQEKLAKDADNYIDTRKFISDNKATIIELSLLSKDRNIFTGFTSKLINPKGFARKSEINQNGKIITRYHGFNLNTNMMSENPAIERLLAAYEKRILERNNIIQQQFNDVFKKKQSANLQTEIPGPHVTDHMKYILMLNELTKDENELLFNKYVQALMAERGFEDAGEISVEQLIEMDFSTNLVTERLSVISNSLPELREQVDSYIGKFDSEAVLDSAGYDTPSLPEHFVSDVRTTMAYEATFPDPNKSHLSTRLSAVKDDVMKILKHDNSRMALSATMMAVACTIGGPVGIALSGAKMASEFLKSDKVVDVLNNGQKKLDSALVKLGLKKETIKEKESLIGSKLKSFFENKYVKNGLKVAGIGALVFGVATITAPLIEDGTLAEIASNASDKVGDIITGAGQGLGSGIYDGVESLSGAASYAKEVYEDSTLGDDVLAGLSTLGKASGEIYDDFMGIVSDVDANLTANSSNSSGINFGNDLNVQTESVASQHIEIDAPVTDFQDVKIKEGDTSLWDVASDKLAESLGTEPSPQQISQLIDDLNLVNPGLIHAGDVMKFPADLEKYKDIVKIVEMDWLKDVMDDGESIDSVIEVDITSATIDISESYNISGIISSVGSTASLAEITKLNADLNLYSLNPGDSINIPTESGNIEYTVPEIDNVIFQQAFPSGIPEFLDKDAFLDAVKDLNPEIDLSSGFFGNSNLGNDILNAGDIKLPEVNIANLDPENRTFLLDASNIQGKHNINETLLRAAYPDGLPAFIDEKSVLNDIKSSNPGLSSLIRSDRSFEKLITIGSDISDQQEIVSTQNSVITQNALATNEDKLFEKGSNESFMRRVRSRGLDGDLSI